MGMTCRPLTTAASAALSFGTSRPILPSALARSAIGRTPLTVRTAPVRARSPTLTKFAPLVVGVIVRCLMRDFCDRFGPGNDGGNGFARIREVASGTDWPGTRVL